MELDGVSQINFKSRKSATFSLKISKLFPFMKIPHKSIELSDSVRLGYYRYCFVNLDGLTILILCVVG